MAITEMIYQILWLHSTFVVCLPQSMQDKFSRKVQNLAFLDDLTSLSNKKSSFSCLKSPCVKQLEANRLTFKKQLSHISIRRECFRPSFTDSTVLSFFLRDRRAARILLTLPSALKVTHKSSYHELCSSKSHQPFNTRAFILTNVNTKKQKKKK